MGRHSSLKDQHATRFIDFLIADFMAGVDAALKTQIEDNQDYALARIGTAVAELLTVGVNQSVVRTALEHHLRKITSPP